MSRMIQIRNVPETLHRKLKSRAALAGMSLSDYLLAELGRVADGRRPKSCVSDWLSAPRLTPCPSPAEAIRAERDAR